MSVMLYSAFRLLHFGSLTNRSCMGTYVPTDVLFFFFWNA